MIKQWAILGMSLFWGLGSSAPLWAANSKPATRKATLPRRAKPATRKATLPRRAPALPTLRRYKAKAIALSFLLAESSRNNPTLVRLRRMIQVLRQREKQAGPWPDLQVGAQVSNFPLPTFNPTLTAMSGIHLTISQRFPVLRRLGLQKKFAKYTTRMIQEELREKTVWIHYRIKELVHWLSYFREALKTEKELHGFMGQVAEVARTKYSVGKATQQNYLQAWTAQAQIHNRMLLLGAKERIKRYQIARLLGSGKAPVGRAPDLRDKPFLHTVTKLYQVALKRRGAIQRWHVSARQSRVLLNLARSKYWPDVTVQLGFRQRFPNPADSGNPFLSLGVKVAIPSWGNSARMGLVQEAMARHQLAASRVKETQAQIRERLRIASAQLKQYNQRIAVFRTRILPLALQTYRSALASYQVDRVDFLTLLSNLQTLYKEKLRLVYLRTQRAITLARLTAIAGL